MRSRCGVSDVFRERPFGGSEPARSCGIRRLGCSVLVAASSLGAAGADPRPAIAVPRVVRAPAIDDFTEMKPSAAVEGSLARVQGFTQLNPEDGSPATQPTDVYLGYDALSLYAVFVAFDSEPGKLRARLARREDILDDDLVELVLDTFNDQRRAYSFTCNPIGVQVDSLWTEGGGYNDAFDTVWRSEGRLTSRGFVVLMAIPFRSLRFPAASAQTWGVQLARSLRRNNETATWPRQTERIEGRLNQAGLLLGLEGVSPGRNLQLNPYAGLRSLRTLDTSDPASPGFARDSAPDAGLDAKLVFKDSVVLDLAANPDFSQIESDEPQLATNQRFELFFPEKRPFFLENAGFFETPIRLFFSRRIADPQLGVRLTGKLGAFAVGALFADDQAPGKAAPPDGELAGERARFSVARVSRDVLAQSSLGLLYTDHRLRGSENRVFGLDGRMKLSSTWVATFQVAASHTASPQSGGEDGTAVELAAKRSGRSFLYDFQYSDRSPGFRSLVGFVPRTDIRLASQTLRYSFRPEGQRLVSWGPALTVEGIWDHCGTRLDQAVRPALHVELKGPAKLQFFFAARRERLRPSDHPLLEEARDFGRNSRGVEFSFFARRAALTGNASRGPAINLDPPAGHGPRPADADAASLTLTIHPTRSLSLATTAISSRLRDGAARVFSDRVLRSKLSLQLSRELSLRFIVQYQELLADPARTSLRTTRGFNADVLLTYLVSPGTALYAGYNGNWRSLDPVLLATPFGAGSTGRDLVNDGHQVFVKIAYLARF